MPITEETTTPAGVLMTRCFVCRAPIPADDNLSASTRDGHWTCKGACATHAFEDELRADRLVAVVDMLTE
jgi:hypothetical protein